MSKNSKRIFPMKVLKYILIFSLCALVSWGAFQIDWRGGHSRQTCPFCDLQILQTQNVYRGEFASVLLTHKPAVEGHLLIIPNRHMEMFDELTSEELQEIATLVQKVHRMYQTLYRTSDYLILQKNGALAGQSVPHVHFHLLPRTVNIGTLQFAARFFRMVTE